jgi:kinesin family protein 5
MDVIRNEQGAGNGVSPTLQSHESHQMRSLQQRLEQLVAVHRQLLRKFASLELENSELRKKLVLRDERIKQLETNAKGLTANLRQQAERHISELTSLRENIEVC